MLEVKNLTKAFKKTRAVDDMSYTFESGVYGLLGPNGAGKTTLLRSIATLYPLKNGDILYNGESIAKSKTYLNNIGYLPQKFGMLKELTVSEALYFFANAKGINKNDAKPMVDETLELVHLSDEKDKRVRALSGGMLRRLGIGQALLGNPEIIIFDEPTAGLDPEERIRFKNVISSIRSKRDSIIIISTHIVEDVEATCDMVVIFDKGKVIESGSCQHIQGLAKGKVYIVPQDRLSEVKSHYVTQKIYEQEGIMMAKILCNDSIDFEQAKETVEDGYICTLNKL